MCFQGKWLTVIASTAAQWMEKNIFSKREKSLMNNDSFNHDSGDVEKLEASKYNRASRNGRNDLNDSDAAAKNEINSDDDSDCDQTSPLSVTSKSEDSEIERSDFL